LYLSFQLLNLIMDVIYFFGIDCIDKSLDGSLLDSNKSEFIDHFPINGNHLGSSVASKGKSFGLVQGFNNH